LHRHKLLSQKDVSVDIQEYQGTLDTMDYQAEMVEMDSEVTKVITVNLELADLQARMALKETKENWVQLAL